LETARCELAWDSEASSVAMAKLEEKFVSPLEVEDVSLFGFENGSMVRIYMYIHIGIDTYTVRISTYTYRYNHIYIYIFT